MEKKPIREIVAARTKTTPTKTQTNPRKKNHKSELACPRYDCPEAKGSTDIQNGEGKTKWL